MLILSVPRAVTYPEPGVEASNGERDGDLSVKFGRGGELLPSDGETAKLEGAEPSCGRRYNYNPYEGNIM